MKPTGSATARHLRDKPVAAACMRRFQPTRLSLLRPGHFSGKPGHRPRPRKLRQPAGKLPQCAAPRTEALGRGGISSRESVPVGGAGGRAAVSDAGGQRRSAGLLGVRHPDPGPARPMTDGRTALSELADGALVREVPAFAAGRIMDADVEWRRGTARARACRCGRLTATYTTAAGGGTPPSLARRRLREKARGRRSPTGLTRRRRDGSPSALP